MPSRLWILYALITAMCLAACGEDGGNTNNAQNLTFKDLGDEETFTVQNVRFDIRMISNDEVTIQAQNLNQVDQVDIAVSDNVTGALLMQKLFLKPGETVISNSITVSSSDQFHFEVENVGTIFVQPACNQNNQSCITSIDVSIQLT